MCCSPRLHSLSSHLSSSFLLLTYLQLLVTLLFVRDSEGGGWQPAGQRIWAWTWISWRSLGRLLLAWWQLFSSTSRCIYTRGVSIRYVDVDDAYDSIMVVLFTYLVSFHWRHFLHAFSLMAQLFVHYISSNSEYHTVDWKYLSNLKNMGVCKLACLYSVVYSYVHTIYDPSRVQIITKFWAEEVIQRPKLLLEMNRSLNVKAVLKTS